VTTPKANTKARKKHDSWEQWEGEPEEAFAAFVQYRDQTKPRAILRVFGARNTKLLEWSQTFEWKRRVLAYDRHHDAIRLEATESVLAQKGAEVAAEHLLLLKDTRELVARELKKLVEASRNSDMPGLLRTNDLIKMTDMVVKLDRLLRGESTENLGVTDELDYSGLTIEEIKQLKDLRAKAKRGNGPGGEAP